MKKNAAPLKATPKAKKKAKTPPKKMASRASNAPVRRFASGGPAGPNGPNSGPSGTHDTKTSSGRSQNSSPKSPSGPSGPNSSSSGTHSTRSSGSSGSSRGSGGQNSGVGRDSSRGLGQGAGGSAIGRGSNDRSGGPKSPMSGQGTSYPSQSVRTSAPNGMVGTPRGYVNREAMERVDEAMAPVAAVGQQLPYFTPGVGPLVGRVATGIAGAIAPAVRAAAPYVSSALGRAPAVMSAEQAARIKSATDAYQKAAAAAGRKPGELAVDYNRIRNMESLAAARGRQTPITGEKVYNKVQDAIDATTSRLGLGVGETARAKAVSGLSAGHGVAQGTLEAGDRIGNSIRDRQNAAERAERERGKTDFGGYRKGGPVRRTFKDK